MLRNFEEDAKQFGLKSLNCLITGGGIGDMLSSFPAINYIANTYPWVNLLVWLPDHMVELSKNTLSTKTVVRGYSEADKKYDNARGGITLKWDGRVSPMKRHPVDYAFNVLCDEDPTIEHKNYPKADISKVDLQKFNLPEKYVVIQATAIDKVKEMPVATANALSWYVKEVKGYIPVYLGKTEAKSGIKIGNIKATELLFDKSRGIDLVDKTSLLESIAIIAGAKCIISMDGGLTHLAGFSDTAIIAGYTFVNPEKNLPIRNNQIGWNCFPVVPDESLGCRFCQNNINFVFGKDYRECFPYPKPEDKYLCVKQMTPEKFKIQLDKVL